MKLEFTTVLPVSVNAMYQNQSFFNPKTKSYQPTGKRILTTEGKRVKSRISADARIAVQEQGWNIEEAGDNFFYMDTKVFFNRRGRDSDNLYKALQDSLQGVVLKNDSQFLSRTQMVLFDYENPRIEISIKPVDYVGIFEDLHDREEFEARCEFGEENGCSRYRKGSCSILKDSLSGTVREEVNREKTPNCSSFKAKK